MLVDIPSYISTWQCVDREFASHKVPRDFRERSGTDPECQPCACDSHHKFQTQCRSSVGKVRKYRHFLLLKAYEHLLGSSAATLSRLSLAWCSWTKTWLASAQPYWIHGRGSLAAAACQPLRHSTMQALFSANCPPARSPCTSYAPDLHKEKTERSSTTYRHCLLLERG